MWLFVGLIVVSIVSPEPVGAADKAEPATPAEISAPTTIDQLLLIDEKLATKAQSAIDRAIEQADKGDAAGAAASLAEARRYAVQLEAVYETYLEVHPNDPRANNLFGNVCYDLMNDHSRALSFWEKAVELDPDYADAHNNLGTYWLHSGEPGKAMDEFRKAIKLEPTKADYHFNLAQAYYLYRPVAQEKYGWSLEQVYDHAIEESRTSFELGPDDFKLARDYAMTFFGAEGFGVKPDWAEARAAWKRCRALADSDARMFNTLLNSARAELRAGAREDARKYAQEALTIWPDSTVAKRLIEMSAPEASSSDTGN